ncbi:MAG TPA: 6-phosphogluconolactonase [Thermoanaerobaculia bacterium]|nr:6-phosphogluconolactonase [Thermoanaerobaculia bacterium]
MRVRVVEDAAAVARVSAEIVRRVVDGTGAPVIALPTGRTAVPLYDQLAAERAASGWGLDRAHVFNLDELLLPPGPDGSPHPASFRAYMLGHAGARIGLATDRWEMPDASADPETECARYDRVLAAAGPLDLAVLGIGEDGHVAYNQPGPPVEDIHVVEVPEDVSDTLDVPAEERPLRAITMGLGPLRRARRLLLMASGEAKAEAVRALVLGREDERWPASLLRSHPRFDVVADRAAVSRLRA